MLSVDSASVRLSGRPILSHISLSARPGEVLAICGPNGAGKSTLLSILAGDRRPHSGAALLGDRALSAYCPAALARFRAVMEQAPRAPSGFTARDIVRLGAEAAPLTAAPSIEPFVSAALNDAGVAHLADALIASLSGGERARVHFARVLAQHRAGRLDPAAGPGALLLDEPTASLDLAHQALLLAMTRRCAREGAAAVIVLHDLNLAAAFADRVALLHDGRLTAVDRPEAVLSEERLSSVYGVRVTIDRSASGALRVAPDYSVYANS
ncbi:MAG: heme ABC transporter ATP-binding protein [Neomegalonema sp.]|nr:heme ABC transporter ATP-binding protein [Neomegalonema sp.]